MIKIIPPNSYPFGEKALELIKVGSNGLRGNDLRNFIKRASLQVADVMKKLAFIAGEIPVHLIALGDTEHYNCNRNYDCWSAEACKNNHNTFVKHARFYRDHQNKNTEKSYGVVKYSYYNEPMGRIELIVGLNGTKEAAQKNKGLVADKEIEKLAANEDIPVSMAAKVAYDQCVICGNKAKTRDDYCSGEDEGGTCKGGGCRNKLGTVLEDGRIVSVDNPNPKWFDISNVGRGADRIAFTLGQLDKAASISKIIGGAELAEQLGLVAPFDLELSGISNHNVREQLKLAKHLAELELLPNKCNLRTKTAVEGLENISKKNRTFALKALNREKIALSLTDFIQFVTGSDRSSAEKTAEDVSQYVPNTFNRLIDNVEKLAEELKTNPFNTSNATQNNDITLWAISQKENASLDFKYAQKRAWLSTIRNESNKPTVKKARTTESSESKINLADAYGLYKLAFLYEIKDIDQDFQLTSTLLIGQN